MDLVGAGLGDDVDQTAGAEAHVGRIGAETDRELLDGFLVEAHERLVHVELVAAAARDLALDDVDVVGAVDVVVLVGVAAPPEIETP